MYSYLIPYKKTSSELITGINAIIKTIYAAIKRELLAYTTQMIP